MFLYLTASCKPWLQNHIVDRFMRQTLVQLWMALIPLKNMLQYHSQPLNIVRRVPTYDIFIRQEYLRSSVPLAKYTDSISQTTKTWRIR